MYPSREQYTLSRRWLSGSSLFFSSPQGRIRYEFNLVREYSSGSGRRLAGGGSNGTVGDCALWAVCCSRRLVTDLDSKAANRFSWIQDPSRKTIFDWVDSGDSSRSR